MDDETTKSDIEVLREARKLLVEKGWCQRAYALSGNQRCLIADDTVTALCMLGAIVRVHPESIYDISRVLVKTMWPNTTGDCVAVLERWNDRSERQYSEVIDLFDRTIARLEREGAETT